MFSVKFILGFACGAATMLLLLFLLRAGRPDGIDEDFLDAIAIAAQQPVASVHSEHTEKIYVHSDLDFLLVEKLSRRYPGINFASWSQRPPDLGCVPEVPAVAIVGPCQRNDFIGATFSFPIWRTAEVTVGTYNSGHELLLLKIGEPWRVMSDRWWVM